MAVIVAIAIVRSEVVNGTLGPGQSRTYLVRVNGTLWVNASASVTMKFKIEEELTVVVEEDCREVLVFSWVKRSASVEAKAELRLTVTYLEEEPPAAQFEATITGPELEVTRES